MQCPFCNNSLNISPAALKGGEFHYDCPFCSAGLLFEEGKCEILTEGVLPSASPALPPPPPEGKKSAENQAPPQAADENISNARLKNPSAGKENVEDISNPSMTPPQAESAQVSPPEELKLKKPSLEDAGGKEEALKNFRAENENAGFKAPRAEDKNTDARIAEDKNTERQNTSSSSDEGTLSSSPPPPEVPFVDEKQFSSPQDKPPVEGVSPPSVKEEAISLQSHSPLPPPSAQEEASSEQSHAASASSVQEEAPPLQNPAAEDAPDLESQKKDPSMDDFSDVREFGESAALSHTGPFYYNLRIEEINSKEDRDYLEHVLSDEGLALPGWDIKDGVLKLDQLSPAACHVIVKALSSRPVKISWEQFLASDGPPDHGAKEAPDDGTEKNAPEAESSDNASAPAGGTEE